MDFISIMLVLTLAICYSWCQENYGIILFLQMSQPFIDAKSGKLCVTEYLLLT